MVVLIVLIAQSCKTDPVAYFTEQRENILGSWNVTQTQRAYVSGAVDLVLVNDSIVLTFNSDGTGTRNLPQSSPQHFEWSYQLSPEVVTIHFLSGNGGIIGGNTTFYDVTTNTADHQFWQSETYPTSGSIDKYEYDWDMVRE